MFVITIIAAHIRIFVFRGRGYGETSLKKTLKGRARVSILTAITYLDVELQVDVLEGDACW